MAEESEKRFVAIMEKLFHAPPKSKPSSSATSSTEVQLSRGKKRLRTLSPLGVVEQKLTGNLVEELRNQSASTEAMKPPLCRPWDRGDFFRRLATFKSMTWFAKPQAVSAVNCARRGWVNVDIDTIECEACGTRLLFSTPQSWTQEQVEKTALVFSLKLDSAHKLLCPWVDNICDEGLMQFPPTQTIVLVDGYKARCSALLQLSALPMISSSAIFYMRSPQLEQFLKENSFGEPSESVEASGTDHLGNSPDPASLISYYQAQKLISLCGWELHPLPYTVGLKEGQNQFFNGPNPIEISHAVASGQNPAISVFPSFTDMHTEANGNGVASAELQFDPNSVALVCRICGAKVGLWAFSSIPQPMEFLRLIGQTEINGKSDVDHHNEQGPGSQFCISDSQVALTDIATTSPKSPDEGPLKLNLTIAGGPPPTKQNYRAIISFPVVGRNLRARFSPDSSIKDQLNVMNSSKGCKDQDVLLVSENEKGEGTSKSREANSFTENQSTSSQIAVQDSSGTDRVPGNGSVKTVDLGVGKQCGSLDDRDSYSTTGDDVATINGNNNENFGRILADAHNHTPCDSSDVGHVEPNMLSVNHKSAPSCIEIGLQVEPSEKAIEFDPVRQHRAFCPWITSTGKSAPGWQQTLSALQRHKEFSYPLPENTPSSSIAVDDPIASVRKLFTTQSTKRSKVAHPS